MLGGQNDGNKEWKSHGVAYCISSTFMDTPSFIPQAKRGILGGSWQ